MPSHHNVPVSSNVRSHNTLIAMCNAWNHSINCHCGWGGEGHLGRSHGLFGAVGSTLSSYTQWAKEKYSIDCNGYTSPNARCPVCQDSVYFYQSPEGGRVFFDELGPPWPKHPCTDQREQSNSVRGQRAIASAAPNSSESSARYSWQDDDWAPFICDSINVVPPGVCAAIGGLFRDGHLALLIIEKSFVLRAPYQLKRRDESTFLLSTVQFQSGVFKVFKLIAYRRLKDAIAASKQTSAKPTPIPPLPRAQPRRTSTKSIQPRPNPPSRHPKEPIVKTALQLAFERAQTGGRSET